MIDKQKLLTWIEDQCYVYSIDPEVGDTREDIARFKGSLQILNKLISRIEAGNFDVEEVAHERSEASSASAART